MPKAKQPFKHVELVKVHLWGEMIGAVALDPALGFYVFEYTPRFARTGIQPAPLQMPTGNVEPFVFTDLPQDTHKRLPAMLADTLPDDFGNALIDRYMADRGIDKTAVTPLDRLSYMSNRAMGALEFRPTRAPRHKPTSIELADLVTEARRAVEGNFGDDADTKASLRSIIDVGTSAGGARPKAVIAWNQATKEIRSGQLDAPEGYEHWLLKFDGVGKGMELGNTSGYGRIEYTYYQMATKAGIAMEKCLLLQENGRAHFMTRRFDRAAGGVRHHMQTLCAMNHLDYKRKGTNSYEQLFLTMQRLQLPYEQLQEAFRRMVFNVVGKNCDDHTKNISFRLRQGQPWELSPAYDISFAHNPQGEWTKEHLMSANGRFDNIQRADVMEVADRFGIGNAKVLVERVLDAVAQWPALAESNGIAQDVIKHIQGLQELNFK
jgi:serine/threonine-protein kinase HipA